MRPSKAQNTLLKSLSLVTMTSLAAAFPAILRAANSPDKFTFVELTSGVSSFYDSNSRSLYIGEDYFSVRPCSDGKLRYCIAGDLFTFAIPRDLGSTQWQYKDISFCVTEVFSSPDAKGYLIKSYRGSKCGINDAVLASYIYYPTRGIRMVLTVAGIALYTTSEHGPGRVIGEE